ncbi:hypothetical protein [Marivirga sp.]|uniref:hypothetical protein n=1 Tax=Marivirga sp. TaxID=2018662 RepID=UPI0025E4B40C|nr:hypothetical protein [Marivirga sp.]
MKNETDALTVTIRELEEKRAKELRLLRAQFHTTYESLKPLNLIKSTFDEVSSSSELKSNFLANAIGLGTAVLSKKLVVGSSHNPIKNLFGTLLQFAIGNVVSKHTIDVKSKIVNFLHFYNKRRKESKKEFDDTSNNIKMTEINSTKKLFRN